MSDNEEMDEETALETIEATAQLLNAMLKAAVTLYAREANISEPRAWKNVLKACEVQAMVD